MLTLVQMVLPALVVFTTLFGVLARGNPKPGGVALFARVGVAGLLLGAGLFYLVEKTSVLTGRPELVVNAYRGFLGGGALLLLFALFGAVLKRKPN
jgi:hypothetical protein